MNKIEFMQNQIHDLDLSCRELKKEIQRLKAQKFARFAGEECWIYQGDGSDHLESLVCPVVISPEKLKELVANKSLETD